MKVLLTKEVPGLGVPGDVVEVRDGYARNFLLPRRLAVLPKGEVLSRFGKLRAQYEEELTDRHLQAQNLAERLQGAEFTFTRKVHDQNKLYAAVRPHDLAQALKERFGVEIPLERIRLPPIHEVGTFPVEIQIYQDIKAVVTVRVEPAA